MNITCSTQNMEPSIIGSSLGGWLPFALAVLFARSPNDDEFETIVNLQRKLSTHFDPIYHHQYLIELHGLCDIGPYDATAPNWKGIGFQQRDPASDIRGGGLLCLVNLIYFLRAHHSLAIGMCRMRSNREVQGQNYPWAATSISVTRLVAVKFSLSHALTGRALPRQDMQPRSYYPLLLDGPAAFSRLFCLAFLLFDNEYSVSAATYMGVPDVLRRVEKLLDQFLRGGESIAEVARLIGQHVGGKLEAEIVDI